VEKGLAEYMCVEVDECGGDGDRGNREGVVNCTDARRECQELVEYFQS